MEVLGSSEPAEAPGGFNEARVVALPGRLRRSFVVRRNLSVDEHIFLTWHFFFWKRKFGSTTAISSKNQRNCSFPRDFYLFEVLKIHMPLFGEFGRSAQDLHGSPVQIELSLGRLSKFFEKWRVAF